MNTDVLIQDSAEGDNLALLGAYQAVYESKSLNRVLLWLFGGSSLLVVLIILSWSLQTTYYAYTQYGPAAAFFWGLPWLVLGVILLIFWLLLYIYRFHPIQQKVEVYKNGLIIYQRLPFALRASQIVVLWDQITGIAVSALTGRYSEQTSHRARVYLKPKKTILFHEENGGIHNLSELISRIKVNVYMRRLPIYRSSLQSGSSIDFGPVWISQKEISLHKLGKTQAFSWDKVHQVSALGGDLVVELEPDGGSQPVHRFSISQIPNIELLFQIIREDIEA